LQNGDSLDADGLERGKTEPNRIEQESRPFAAWLYLSNASDGQRFIFPGARLTDLLTVLTGGSIWFCFILLGAASLRLSIKTLY